MSTTETTPADRAKQIRDRLAEIAPYPDTGEATTAKSLARWLAVRSAVINHQQLSADVPLSRSQIDLLTILFAAAHALYALDAGAGPSYADPVAKEIRNAWDDGSGVGERLWGHLGSAACTEIGPLADELVTLQKLQSPPKGLLAHADAIRSALNIATIRSALNSQPFINASVALDRELEQAGGAALMTTTEPATPDIDKDPMWHQAYMDVAAVRHQAYMDVAAVLDKALGTEEEDGAGAGIAADVWLLAHQRDEARAQVAQLAARLKDLTEPGLIPAAGPACVTTDWCVAWGGEDANDCAGRLEYDEECEARDMTQWIDGGIVARQTVIRLPWVNAPDETAGESCCTGCGPGCECGGSPHGEAAR
jgi:hypothetical protein